MKQLNSEKQQPIRLSLEDIKAKKTASVKLENIKGGNSDGCHVEPGFWETLYMMIDANRRAWHAMY